LEARGQLPEGPLSAGPPPPPGPSPRSAVFPVLLVNFIGALGYSIVLPFLVFLVGRFRGNAVVYGLVAATYPAFQLVGAPVLGRWSDRWGRRRVLLVSQAGTLVAWAIFLAALFIPVAVVLRIGATMLTLPVILLFLARALDGLTGGNVSVAQAYMADVSTEENRAANFGRLAISSNLGFILGPAIAAGLGATRWGDVPPVLAALLVSAVGTALVAVYLPESRPRPLPPGCKTSGLHEVLGQEPRSCVEPAGEPPGTAALLRLPGIPWLLALYFVLFLGFNVFYTAFPVHAVRGLGWKLEDTGLFFSVLSLMMVVVEGPLLGRLSRHVSDVSLVRVGALILGANFALLFVADTPLAFVAAALFALGNGLMWPSFLSVLARAAGPRHQGAVQGLGSAVGAAASIVGLIGGGLLYERVEGAAFLVAAGLIELAFLMSFRLRGVPRRAEG
jgi:MFS transporter, DHA1 family, tetracycline resistance protein